MKILRKNQRKTIQIVRFEALKLQVEENSDKFERLRCYAVSTNKYLRALETKVASLEYSRANPAEAQTLTDG